VLHAWEHTANVSIDDAVEHVVTNMAPFMSFQVILVIE
jgi:hypothetical protein